MFTLVSSVRKGNDCCSSMFNIQVPIEWMVPAIRDVRFVYEYESFQSTCLDAPNEKSQKPPFDWYPNSEGFCSDRFF